MGSTPVGEKRRGGTRLSLAAAFAFSLGLVLLALSTNKKESTLKFSAATNLDMKEVKKTLKVNNERVFTKAARRDFTPTHTFASWKRKGSEKGPKKVLQGRD